MSPFELGQFTMQHDYKIILIIIIMKIYIADFLTFYFEVDFTTDDSGVGALP